MSSLQVGIVGLPNAGKSTLFNALSSRRLAETASRPFTTIDPNEAVVVLHDEKFHRLVDMVKPEKSVFATVSFIDIAGLIKNAHKGEGLGNQFLAKIREVDAILHVVRAFPGEDISHVHISHDPGSNEQVMEDIEIVNLELELGEVEKKPTLYVVNVNEKGLDRNDLIEKIETKFGGRVLLVSAKTEEDMIDLDNEEKEEMYKLLQWDRSALERVIKTSYEMLDLISFYTIKGGKEAHAWSVKKGTSCIDASEVVHTDFKKGFIKAEVIGVDDLLNAGGWKMAKEKGLIRLEGKDYEVQNGDVIEFRVNT